MTKFAGILAAAVLAFSFAPAGMAVCNNGEIAVGRDPLLEYNIYANNCGFIDGPHQGGDYCGKYGQELSSTVICDGGEVSVDLYDGSKWVACYATENVYCGRDTIDLCCVRLT